MKDTYRHVEIAFEKLTSNATAILGNSITFIIALCVVIYWFSNDLFYSQDIHQTIGDVILGITFLTLFIIQKAFNRFSALLNLKVNELVISHEEADNTVVNADAKTDFEINEMAKEYIDVELAEEKIAHSGEIPNADA